MHTTPKYKKNTCKKTNQCTPIQNIKKNTCKKTISVFVFAYEKRWFSHDTAHFTLTRQRNILRYFIFAQIIECGYALQSSRCRWSVEHHKLCVELKQENNQDFSSEYLYVYGGKITAYNPAWFTSNPVGHTTYMFRRFNEMVKQTTYRAIA